VIRILTIKYLNTAYEDETKYKKNKIIETKAILDLGQKYKNV
jgi:hypothetical protein